MSYILNLETATKNCSVSVCNDDEILAIKEIATQGFAHAENLHVFIQDVLDSAGTKLKDLNAIAVSQGPGSYTGLRIGVSAAKGLSYALNIPLIAVDTLEILARQLQIESGLIVPMLDARRMEVFIRVFSPNYLPQEDIKALIVEPDSFDKYTGDLHFVGDGAPKLKDVIKDTRFFYHDTILYPSAKEMITIANAKFLAQDFVDVAYFEPYYLKDFVLTTSSKK